MHHLVGEITSGVCSPYDFCQDATPGTHARTQVLNSAQSWTAIGFSEDGAMVGSDAVIGMPANTSVNEYSLTAQVNVHG